MPYTETRTIYKVVAMGTWIVRLILFAATLLGAMTTAMAQSATAEITVLNLGTREVKKYQAGGTRFNIPLAGVPGWMQCTVLPVKEFLFYGNKRMRVDMYCFTAAGAGISTGCTSGSGSLDVSTYSLVSPGTKILPNGDSDAPGGVDITMSCKYL